MSGRSWSGSGRSVRWAMLAVVASFVAGTLVTQYQLSSEVDAMDIAGNAVPDIASIAEARATLRAIERAAANAGDYALQRKRLDENLLRYRTSPEYPGEANLFAPIPDLLRGLDELVARDPASTQLAQRIDEIDRQLHDLMELSRTQLHSSAAAMIRKERRSNRFAVTLDAAAICIAIVATWLVSKTLEEYLSRFKRRSRELEHLAIQVGHEIANPLVPLQHAISLGAERVIAERPIFDRASRSLERIRSSLDRLIRFAESAVPPANSGVSVPVRPALVNASPAGSIPMSGDLDCNVFCAPATLAEMLHDLVAAANPSRIVVKRSRKNVRLSFEGGSENGTTVPFDPELYDERSGHPGIDLRLAAVRRRVEANGGAVGFRQRNGQRTLWIELRSA